MESHRNRHAIIGNTNCSVSLGVIIMCLAIIPCNHSELEDPVVIEYQHIVDWLNGSHEIIHLDTTVMLICSHMVTMATI